MTRQPSIAATVARTVVVVLLVVGALTLLYLLRRPLGWVVLAAFIAVVLSGPVEALARRMPRSLAIAAVYLGMLAVALGGLALVIPPVIEGTGSLSRSLPGHVADLRETIRDNDAFQRLDEQLGIGQRLQELAAGAPARAGDAASLAASLGLGFLSSLFAILTVLVLSVFLVASGRRWTHAATALLPGERRERVERTLRRVAQAISAYAMAQLVIALAATASGYIVMTILGVPFREPLAAVIAVGSLIPVVGSLLWGLAVGLVTLTVDFPTATLVWAAWAVVYPQLENYGLQPLLQGRAVQVEPFTVIFAVICGAALLGIVGAMLAIPVAAAVQIVIREWWDWRRAGAA